MINKKVFIFVLTGWLCLQSLFAIPDYPVRQWHDQSGKAITAQMIGLDDNAITIVRPGVHDLHGKPVEYVLPVSRLSPEDANYVQRLLALQAKYELKLTHLKKTFPNAIKMERQYALERREGILTPNYVPSAEFSERYQRLCEEFNFEQLETQLAYINDRLESDTSKYAQMTGKRHGQDSLAKQQAQNVTWSETYFQEYLGSMVALAMSYQQAVNESDRPKTAPNTALPNLPKPSNYKAAGR